VAADREAHRGDDQGETRSEEQPRTRGAGVGHGADSGREGERAGEVRGNLAGGPHRSHAPSPQPHGVQSPRDAPTIAAPMARLHPTLHPAGDRARMLAFWLLPPLLALIAYWGVWSGDFV